MRHTSLDILRVKAKRTIVGNAYGKKREHQEFNLLRGEAERLKLAGHVDILGVFDSSKSYENKVVVPMERKVVTPEEIKTESQGEKPPKKKAKTVDNGD